MLHRTPSDKIKKYVPNTIPIVSTVDNRSKLFQCTKAPHRSTPFSLRCEKRRRKRRSIRTSRACCERNISGRMARRERFAKSSIFPLIRLGRSIGALRTRYLPRPPGYPLRGRELITEWKLGSWLGGSVGLSLLKISFDNVGPTIPRPKLSFV